MNRPHFVRFNDLAPAHVNRDLQVHTVATDGQATISEMIKRAEKLCLDEIAFTEHVRRTSKYFPVFAAEVREAREKTRVRVYVGLETKADDDRGTLDASPETLSEAEIVLGSVHRFPGGQGRLVEARQLGYKEAAERELTLALGLLRHAPIDVLSHPGGMCQRAFGKFPVEFFEELMRVSMERCIAIEINISYTQDLDNFLALCRKVNPFVSVGSDAHRLGDLGSCRDALRARGIGCA